MPAGILTAIIAACAVFAAALCTLVYWYAFRFEPVNFKVSEIKINLTKNIYTSEGAPPATGIITGIVDNAAVPDFTILHLSDFHLRKDRKGEKLFEFVRSLSSLSPDFLFITGDLVEKDIYSEYLIKMLEGLDARTGKYAVFGVHDYYNKGPTEFIKNMIKRKKEYRLKNDVSGLINKLGGIGIKVLRNERISHALSPDFNINITGLEDSIIDKTDIAKAFGTDSKEDGKKEILRNEHNIKEETDNKKTQYEQNIICGQSINKNNGSNNNAEETLRKSGNCLDEATNKSYKERTINKSYEERTINKSLFVLNEEDSHNLNDTHKIEICLTHTPDMDLFDRLVENGVDIVLAGHTHGGQVRLPGIGAIISGCDIKAKYASGLFYFKKFVLYVSRGLGEGRYSPFRFYCPPEATVINICLIQERERP